MDTPPLLRFGPFELDTRSRELREGSRLVRLQEQPFEILRRMLARPGHVVTRDELRDGLWPDGTFVDFEHSLNAAVKRLRAALGDDANNPRFVETLPRRGYRFIAPVVSKGDSRVPVHAATSPAKLAVLPFASLSEDEGQEYFVDGLTEEMITQLGQLCRGRVGVIARWSSMTFKGTTQRARDIGAALGASYLLEGSVRREADRVRVTARLIDAAGETQLWAETYERHLSDCLSVQADVAARIARSLAVELAPPIGPMSTATSASAYQEYLKGRYHWNKLDDEREFGSGAALEPALARLSRALDIDPDFAPAHALVSRIHIARAQQYLDVPKLALETARRFATRALDLDPDLAEGHLALGDVRRMLDWDWPGAEQAYIHAIALNPSQENAHRRYALMLAVQSRRADAVREAERACELDPVNLIVSVTAGLVHYLTGDPGAAIARCRRIVDLGPHYLPAWRLLGAACLQMGQTREALEAFEAARPLEAANAPVVLPGLAHAAAVAGDRAAAAAWLDHWQSLGGDRYLSQYYLALAHLGLGAIEEAWTALERACLDRDPAVAYIAVEPRLASLRADPRFTRLLERIGLG